MNTPETIMSRRRFPSELRGPASASLVTRRLRVLRPRRGVRRGGRAYSVVRLLAVAAASLVLSATVSAQTEEPWLSTEWTVRCDLGSVWTEGSPHPPEAGHLLSEEECDDEGFGPAAHIAESLRSASEWLEGLKFKGPSVEFDTIRRRYRVTIANAELLIQRCRDDAGSDVEVVGCYDRNRKRLIIGQDTYFAMDSTDYGLEWDNARLGTAAHEMFHGVTQSYPSFSGMEDWPLWITEGTAELIALQHVRKISGLSVQSPVRNFSRPLHRPADKADAYNTGVFWGAIGKELQSPDDVAYIHDLFDDDRRDFSTHDGLAGVDQGLQEWGGLHRLFPRVLASPDIRHHAESAYDLRRVILQLPESGSTVAEVTHTVERVAADAYRVTARVPVGKRGLLSVDVEDASGDLHLVVDDQVVAGLSFSRYVDAGEEDVLVVIANVAELAVNTVDRHYKVEIRLEEATCDQDDVWQMLADLGDRPGWQARITGVDAVRTGTLRGGVNPHGDLHLSLQAIGSQLDDRLFLPTFALRVAGPLEVGQRRYGVGAGSFVAGTMTVPGGERVAVSLTGTGTEVLPGVTDLDIYNEIIDRATPDHPPRRVTFRDMAGSVWFDEGTGPGLARGIIDIVVVDRARPQDRYHFCGAFQQFLEAD